MRFLLRLPVWLHRQLLTRAAAHDLSLNEYCVRMLAAAEPATIAEPTTVALREHAHVVFGSRLAGIVALGSWARGEATSSSDVDVLIAVDPSQRLTRTLYRDWDKRALTWGGRSVDAHFVHLPAEATLGGSLWCEAATDGILVYDRDGATDAALRRIRRAVADGRLLRKHSHGQPYWTVAA